ncbi:hypothetical protein Mapa_001711 [Marchantia paleacea]|nr:hypothetical protein Mapa_001711 [Marchantia paleacea]
MGGMLLLGVMVWTVLLLSAVHVSSAGEALSAVDSLPCTGSGCGAETVELRSSTERAIFKGREILATPELGSAVRQEDYSDVARLLAADYGSVPPPPRATNPGNTPHLAPPAPPPLKRRR